MPIGPRPSDVPRIRTTLAVYKVSSYITGFFLIALVVIVMNLVADLLYGFLDPRVSHAR